MLLVAVLVLVLVLILIGIQYKDTILGIEDVAGIMAKKLEVVSRMRIDLLKSVDAEKSAVMADTDESSQAFADQAQKAAEAVDRGRLELGLLVKKDHTDQEMKLLQEFDGCWIEFRKIDRVLLEFAVKNTNIKAANLSFVKGSEAMKRFEKALNDLNRKRPLGAEGTQIGKLAGDALAAGLKIHYLHAPHIAAANDEQMDKIEVDIKQNEEGIKRSLNELQRLIPEKKQASLQEARTAYDELAKVTTEVIDLSRQNTNIKSFELSLGRKRKLTAQCDEILISLQEAVRSRSFKATR